MQELLFSELSAHHTESFDGYICLDSAKAKNTSAYVCLFFKIDANGKKRYLVGERHWVTTLAGDRFKLINIKEHKHTKYRAETDYWERVEHLGT